MRAMSRPDLACETAVRRRIDVGAVELSLMEWGTPGRPALCFLHGGAAHAHWFDRVVPAFADRFHVIALDQRGHGESGWPRPAAYATRDFAADLGRVMDAMAWRRMTVVGHSMGGHNAMSFAAWHPERVDALVIVDSRPAIPPERLGVMHRRGQRGPRRHPSREEAAAAFRLLPRETVAEPAFLAHLGEAGVVQRDGGWVTRYDPEANGQRRPVDAWTLVGQVAAPTLVVRAALSPILPPDMAERLCASIPGSTLVEIADAYHHVVLDRPAEFVEALDRFLKSL
jgi:pimeloyl-ACP methyl ester carboxylesterase